MKLFFSPCYGSKAESLDCSELGRLAAYCKTPVIKLVSTPEDADIILLVNIYEADIYGGLRQNKIWKKWPEKSFVYYEGDHPFRFLHGLQSSAHKSWSGSGRFQSCAYPLHQLFYPNPCPPLADMEGSKDLLFSFAGRASHRVRKQLFAMAFPPNEVIIQNTTAYYHFDNKSEHRENARKNYWELARRSKYALCPRGFGTSSIRIFEMMEAGIAPVIIADDWLPPLGPRWEDFALFIPEREIGLVYGRIKAHETEYTQRGRLARQAWEQFFSAANYWNFILESLRQIQTNQKIPESIYLKWVPVLIAKEWLRHKKNQGVIRLKSRIKQLMRGLIYSTRPGS